MKGMKEKNTAPYMKKKSGGNSPFKRSMKEATAYTKIIQFY